MGLGTGLRTCSLDQNGFREISESLAQPQGDAIEDDGLRDEAPLGADLDAVLP